MKVQICSSATLGLSCLIYCYEDGLVWNVGHQKFTYKLTDVKQFKDTYLRGEKFFTIEIDSLPISMRQFDDMIINILPELYL